ncbi:MAG TPA: COX aromatic rich motif-containing protein, partial [Patescibacteria group bacterium]|nr:COX aromatic rich motif-containing protein [Patescibacteria group bacterium]
RFTAQASSENDFETWLKDAKKINQDLSLGSYERLAEPSLHNPVAIYSATESNLYNKIVMKFMDPAHHEAEHQHDSAHFDYEDQP